MRSLCCSWLLTSEYLRQKVSDLLRPEWASLYFGFFHFQTSFGEVFLACVVCG